NLMDRGMMSSPVLSRMREDYKLGHLDESTILHNPFIQFDKWFQDELQWKKIAEPNAMTLCTCSKEGKPSGRIVLLKFFDENGYVLFTNYNGRKSREMTDNPNASLVFYWSERQVRVEGTVERTTRQESEDYFKTRPRTSQIGAWVSEYQSAEVTESYMRQRQLDIEKQFEGVEVPVPSFWGGWRIKPTYFEFWQGKGGRIHDRFKFTKNTDFNEGSDTEWTFKRLS
ncbi:hypothetical protein SAMD00019534_036390, partial [Acytostelium subglobosum LB1]|uniref:hypothetical protein n=1 Tax=Acytostelium subglobosum LB1 TaxID=1410327 RepID=UPI00064517BC